MITPSTLFEFVSYADTAPEAIGMIGGKLMEYHTAELIQSVGCTYFKWIGMIREIGHGEKDTGQWDNRIFPIDYVVGASIFVSTDVLRIVGSMEEKYFLYFEEIDWALRLKKLGWQIGFCPEAKVYHKGGATIKGYGDTTRMMDFYYARNRILLARKFFPYTLPTLMVAFGWFAIRRLMRGQFDRVIMLVRIMIRPHLFFKE